MKSNRILSAISVAAVIGMSSIAAHAQNAPSYGDNPPSAQKYSENNMVARVKQALHSEPALNDKHIDVSMKNGKVVMKGFVDSQGDLEKAVRAANKTAGGKNVVNELTIQRHDESNTST